MAETLYPFMTFSTYNLCPSFHISDPAATNPWVSSRDARTLEMAISSPIQTILWLFTHSSALLIRNETYLSELFKEALWALPTLGGCQHSPFV